MADFHEDPVTAAGVVRDWSGVPVEEDEDFDPTPCCPDPGCPGNPCTFPGYADNH